MTATDAVVSTTELLEMILVDLPLNDILIARAVCQHWNSLINSSLRLRRANFRASDGRGYLSLHPYQHGPDFLLHPLLAPSSGGFHVCPILGSRKLDQPHSNASETWATHMDLHEISISSSLLNEIAKERTQCPALQSMFLTQPPCTTISLNIRGTAMCESLITLREESGITIGVVAEIAEKALTQAQRCVHPIYPLTKCEVRLAFQTPCE